MLRPVFLLAAAAALAAAAPMTYTVTGTGSGSWNSTPFTNASFSFTFTSDTATIVHGTACCSNADTTPPGTSATVTVSGFAPATLTGDQAIFMNRTEATAGIWHFNSPDYITIGNSAFANSDLTTPMPCCTSGTTFSYVTPMALSTGGTLYFSSVSGVSYSQQPGNPGSTIYPVSVTPGSGTQQEYTTQTYTVVVGDTSGAGDIAGVDVQFRDKPTQPNACWLYYNAASNALAVNHQGNWGAGVPVGSGGSVLTGDGCTVDTTAVTVSTSGNNLTLAIPMQPTFADGNPWQIFVDAQTKGNVDAGYSQLGTVTVRGGQPFTLSIDPRFQSMVAGASINFTVTVTATGGFNQPISFSGSSTRWHGSSGAPLTFAFNPSTLSGSGTTTMTVTSPDSAIEDDYFLTFAGTSQSVTETVTDGIVYVATAPPVITASPTSSVGSSQKFTFSWSDNTDLRSLNALFAPTVDGRNACWISFDGSHVYLASDDGASWMDAGYAGSGYPGDNANVNGSNSQCVIGGTGTIYSIDSGQGNGYISGYHTLTLPIFFRPGVMSSAAIYVDASDTAGLDSGYLAKGSWSAQ